MGILEKLKQKLPSNADVSDVCFEGSELVVYIKNKDMFVENGHFVKDLAKEFKKRIDLRPATSIRKDMEEAKENIKKVVPDEAEIREITFEPGFGRVIIEAVKPGLVIGKGGRTLEKIKKNTYWSPVVKRASVIKSDVVDTVRRVLYQESEFRKDFLNDIGKRIHGEEKKDVDWLRLSFLGGFREVGRSCLLLQTPESNVMLDCGIKPGGGFPYLQAPEVNIQDLDAVILSHPHLDHCGFIPYLYEYGYEGPLYCTPPTRDLMVLLDLDYIDIAKREGDTVPYSSKSVEKAVKHSVCLEYNEVSDITPDMRLTFHNAGHLLGSALSHIHVGQGFHNIVYSGDHNYGESRLFDPAFTNFRRIETLITESTYGAENAKQPRRADAEKKLIKTAKKTLKRGGKVLIPSFAVGRAQEVMCVLSDQKEFDYPVYLEGMLWDATAIHTTYPEYLNKKLQNKILHKGENPFVNEIFKRVGSKEERDEILRSPDPCIILSTSGMLTGGPVMEYLKKLAEDKKNTLIFVGYQAEGTMGRRIQNGWDEIPITTDNGKRVGLEMNMEVKTVEGLSGHSDRNQLSNFVRNLNSKPGRIICNHGDNSSCINLCKSLHKKFNVETVPPKNLEVMRLD
ncbi:MAG: beta-CASP ribonuclease aCPSF1 [Candidatus Aenigmatarchaeota archaeon]